MKGSDAVKPEGIRTRLLNLRKQKKRFVRPHEFPDETEALGPNIVGSTSTNRPCKTDVPAAEDACPPTRPSRSNNLTSDR